MSGNVTAVVPFSKKLEWVVDGPAPLVLAGQGCRRSHAPAEGHDSWKPAGAIVGEGVSLVFIRADAVAICRDVTPRGIQASEPQVGTAGGSPRFPIPAATGSTLKARRTRRKRPCSPR